MKKKTKVSNNDRVKRNSEFKKKQNDENDNEVANYVSKINDMQHDLN